MKLSPLATAILGIAGSVIGLGFVLVAHGIGMKLDPLVENGTIIGSMASMGVGAYGARQMPTKGDGQ